MNDHDAVRGSTSNCERVHWLKLKINLIWLFVLTAIVALSVVIHLRSRSALVQFLPPSTLSYRVLEYEWGRYHEMIVFSADTNLADVDEWYTSNFNVHSPSVDNTTTG